MGRPKSCASVKKGNSESKAQLKKRQEIEEALKGNDDKLDIIPKYLTKEEQIYYKWLLEELNASNVVSNLDQPLIEQVANILYVMRMADDDIRKNGLMIKSFDKYGNEKMIPNPCIKIKLDYQSKYTTLCNQLPLSPASRASLAAKKVESKEQEQDPVLRLLMQNNAG